MAVGSGEGGTTGELRRRSERLVRALEPVGRNRSLPAHRELISQPAPLSAIVDRSRITKTALSSYAAADPSHADEPRLSETASNVL